MAYLAATIALPPAADTQNPEDSSAKTTAVEADWVAVACPPAVADAPCQGQR